jgi:hypothetical protein
MEDVGHWRMLNAGRVLDVGRMSKIGRRFDREEADRISFVLT